MTTEELRTEAQNILTELKNIALDKNRHSADFLTNVLAEYGKILANFHMRLNKLEKDR